METDNLGKYDIKSAVRCFAILDLAIEQTRPLTILDVCEKLGVNSNMAFRMLSTLVSSGYLSKDDHSDTYTVSLKSLKLSARALQSLEIRKVAMPSLELLWSQYPLANGNLGVMYEDEILIIDRIDSQSIPRTHFTPGKKVPFYCSGLGKVLASSLPDKEIDALISRTKIKPLTKYTITDPVLLKKELLKVREEGVGRDCEEFVLDDNCVAVPIINSKGKTVCAISLSALSSNMKREKLEEAVPKLKETAAAIASLMGY